MEISLEDWKKRSKSKTTLLLDIRETAEFAEFNMGGLNIPPHEIPDRLAEFEGFKTIVVACSNGTRSSMVRAYIAKKLPKTSVYFLSEGIL